MPIGVAIQAWPSPSSIMPLTSSLMRPSSVRTTEMRPFLSRRTPSVSLPALVQLALKQAQNKTVQTLLGSLGDLTGWLAAEPAALTGSATLGIK